MKRDGSSQLINLSQSMSTDGISSTNETQVIVSIRPLLTAVVVFLTADISDQILILRQIPTSIE